MYEGLIFATVTAIVFGLWTVFHNQAAKYIDPVFGAVIVSLTAVIVGLVFLIPRLKAGALWTDQKGLIFVILAGICAFAIDFFALKAYGSGLSVSVGGPIIIAGSVAIAAVIGFAIGDPITLAKLAGIGFIVIGSGILAAVSQ